MDNLFNKRIPMKGNYYYLLSIIFLLNISSLFAQDSYVIQTSEKTTDQIDPLLSDIWGGVNCLDTNGNSIYPGNYYTPNHASPGCVAISMSQILHFYEWPIVGMGNNVYSDEYDGTLVRHASFMDNIEYDWTNMLNEYHGNTSTEIQQQAIGELFYSADCALQMNFEPTGSTSNIDKTPFAYENHFRYTSHYEDISWSLFWDRLKENILAGFPVPVAVDASRTGDGHVFVVNGYKEENGKAYYHLNWGWYGANNGWYNIEDWTSESPGYNTITGAVFDVLPNPQITSIVNTGNGNNFTINWDVSAKINWNEFTLEQKVNHGTWEEVATGITAKNYTVINPTGDIYQFRVKSTIDGIYYDNSWSETEIFIANGGYDGYVSLGGSQYAYARQTPNNDLNFTGDYTFESWIRLKDGNTNGNVIFDQQTVFGLEINNVTASDYTLKFNSHATNSFLSSNVTGEKLKNNEWVHIAVTHSDNITKLFINGIIRDENTGTDFNLISSNNALNIGERYSGGYSGLIKADFDQIRFSTIARYTSNFTAFKQQIYYVDANTIAYFNFQNVHKVRLKDDAFNLSVIVQNEPNFMEWNFEETSQPLATQDELDDDNDGVSNNVDLCLNTPLGESVDENGCSESQKDDDNDGVMNTIDQCPNTTEGSTVNTVGCFTFEATNFSIETVSETCSNMNNGQISITAQAIYNYTTTINGTVYNFNNTLVLDDLSPGTYDFCIGVNEENYEQCYSVTIEAGITISGKASLTSKKASVQIFQGTAPYLVYINGKTVLETSSNMFDIVVNNGDLLEVKTAINCEGVFSKNIKLLEAVVAFPNPTQGIFEVSIPSLYTNVTIELFNMQGALISKKNYQIVFGKVELNLEKMPAGLYVAKIYLNKPVSLKIIKK